MNSTSKKLNPRDFVYVYEPGIGQTYQNGPYTILVGRESYAVTYKGKTIDYNLRNFLSAFEACVGHHQRQSEKPEVKFYSQCWYTWTRKGEVIRYWFVPLEEARCRPGGSLKILRASK